MLFIDYDTERFTYDFLKQLNDEKIEFKGSELELDYTLEIDDCETFLKLKEKYLFYKLSDEDRYTLYRLLEDIGLNNEDIKKYLLNNEIFKFITDVSIIYELNDEEIFKKYNYYNYFVKDCRMLDEGENIIDFFKFDISILENIINEIPNIEDYGYSLN